MTCFILRVSKLNTCVFLIHFRIVDGFDILIILALSEKIKKFSPDVDLPIPSGSPSAFSPKSVRTGVDCEKLRGEKLPVPNEP